MTSTIDDRTGSGPPSPDVEVSDGGGRRRRPFRLRDMYVERRDGPVTWAERRREALASLVFVPVFFGIVAGVQVWGRGRDLERSWFVTAGAVTVGVAVMSFAFPRFSPGGYAHLRNIDWSKESRASKVAGAVGVLLLLAVFVWRAVHRMDD